MPLILSPTTHWSLSSENLSAAWPRHDTAWGDPAVAAQFPRCDPPAATRIGVLSQPTTKKGTKSYRHDGILAPELISLKIVN